MTRQNGIRLTKRSVDALRAGKRDRIFWDRDLAGFGVRVYASGRKVFIVQSRGEGGSKRITLGPHGPLPAEAARKQAAEVIGRIKRGEAAESESTGPVTMADLTERVLRVFVAVHCKLGTVSSYRGILKNYIVPALGARTVESVGRANVIALHQRLHNSPGVANKLVKVLSRMMTMAESWELIPAGTNPCRPVRLYKTTERKRFLTRRELKRLGRVLNEAEADGSVWSGAIAAVRLLVLTGCRRAEILSLRWDDVDRTARVLRLRDSKTGARMVPLTAPVTAVLDGIQRTPGSDHVIVGKRFGSAVTSIFDHWERIRKRAGLSDVRLYDLRHSYASRALTLGEGLPTIGRLLGHRHVVSTARYAHLVRDVEKAAATRVVASIGEHLAAQDRQRAREGQKTAD